MRDVGEQVIALVLNVLAMAPIVLPSIDISVGAIFLPLNAGAFAGRNCPVSFGASLVTMDSGFLSGQVSGFAPGQ
jgi:hypothetical protein